MDNYVFRALNEQDQVSVSNQKGIWAKIESKDCTLKELFQTINNHLLNGSRIPSSWISCSTSFPIVIEKYTSARQEFEASRGLVAIIQNHSQNTLENKQKFNLFSGGLSFIQHHQKTIWHAHTTDVVKIIYNLSKREQAKPLGYSGLILTKQGQPCGSNVLAYGYAAKNKEVLVYNHIPQQDIVRLLTPLEQDILYACHHYPPYFIALLEGMIKNKTLISIDNRQLNDIEAQLFYDLYTKNLHLKQVAQAVHEESPDTDILAIFATLREVKRSFITKLISSFFPTLPQVDVVEDTLDAIRIGEADFYDSMAQYCGKTFPLISLSKEQDMLPIDLYHGVNDITLINIEPTIMQEHGDLQVTDENTYWLIGKEPVIKRQLFNKKQHQALLTLLDKELEKVSLQKHL